MNDYKNGHSLIFAQAMREKYDVYVSLSEAFGGGNANLALRKIVEAWCIEVPRESRRQGLGSKVLKELCEWADKNNLILALTPSNEMGTPMKVLRKWYHSFGFHRNRGRYKDYRTSQAYIREPKEIQFGV